MTRQSHAIDLVHTDRLSRFTSNSAFGLCVSLFIALAFALWLLPSGFVTGGHPYWAAQNEDITVYLAGFNAFFHEAWHWPLWRIDSLNWPEGTLTTFVDVIPLYAALLKLLAPAHWFPFNPFGYWVAACLLLQSAGSWWVLREARVQSWSALIALTLLLLMFPAWLSRMGHISLLAQWILVFSVALCLRSTRTHFFSGAGWCALLCAAFFINFYLFAMAATLFAADALRCIRTGCKSSVLFWLFLTLGLLSALTWATLWPLPGNTGAPDTGFGAYSMNLLSPFSGGRWLKLSPPVADQAFEGFNYLGLGGIFLMLSACFGLITKHKAIHTPDQSPFYEVWLALFLVTLYALSNRVYFGNHLLWSWSIPAWAETVTGQLRASGRFFWLVGYTLLIFAVISIYRHFSRGVAGSLMLIALSVQTVDLWPQLQHLRHIEPRPGATVIDFKQWDAALPVDTATLYFFPKFKCGRQSDLFVTLLPVMRYASERGLNINTGYIARHNPVCAKEKEEIAGSNPAHAVYVFSSQEYGATQIPDLFPEGWAISCRTLDFATLCSRLAHE